MEFIDNKTIEDFSRDVAEKKSPRLMLFMPTANTIPARGMTMLGAYQGDVSRTTWVINPSKQELTIKVASKALKYKLRRCSGTELRAIQDEAHNITLNTDNTKTELSVSKIKVNA